MTEFAAKKPLPAFRPGDVIEVELVRVGCRYPSGDHRSPDLLAVLTMRTCVPSLPPSGGS